MNEKRFIELLRLYLEKGVNEQEQQELMAFIRSGRYDHLLKDRIDNAFSQGIVREDMDTERADRIRRGILTTERSDAKVLPIGKTRGIYRWMAVAAATSAIAILSLWWLAPKGPEIGSSVVAIEHVGKDQAVFSGKQFVRLPDGSTVLLNEGSQLSYASVFGKKVREVNLVGEGYFDVKHHPSVPFRVVTGKVTTTVLGTAFNVNAYPGKDEIKITVTRGKVEVSDDKRTLGVITKDQQIAINTVTNDPVQSRINGEEEEDWTHQYLILDDISFEEAVDIISQKYGVEILLENDLLQRCRLTATFLHNENLEQILAVVTNVVEATYEISPDGKIRIDGKGCFTIPDNDTKPNQIP